MRKQALQGEHKKEVVKATKMRETLEVEAHLMAKIGGQTSVPGVKKDGSHGEFLLHPGRRTGVRRGKCKGRRSVEDDMLDHGLNREKKRGNERDVMARLGHEITLAERWKRALAHEWDEVTTVR